jgi:hypothetical protein
VVADRSIELERSLLHGDQRGQRDDRLGHRGQGEQRALVSARVAALEHVAVPADHRGGHRPDGAVVHPAVHHLEHRSGMVLRSDSGAAEG